MRGWWWLWSGCPGVGIARMAALQAVAAEQKLTLRDLWAWPLRRLQSALGWSDALMARIDRYRLQRGMSPDLAVPLDVVLPMDDAWPGSLNQLESPPLALHCQGDPTLLPLLAQRRAIAVVGTRAASDHGLEMADRLGRAMAEAGWPVLSGLADGIDAAAHRGCLAAGGVPVAVLGTPLNRTYPRHHIALQAEVSEQGLLLSERRPGERVQPGHFASRNRLLVAMAQALVVVECPERSGALISAQLATDLQCPVWVIPADAARWSARGSNRLLRDHAAALLAPEDLIEHLGPGPCLPTVNTVDHTSLLQALGEGATLDELAVGLQRSPAGLASDLLHLELSGQVLCESGFLWKASRR